MEEIWNLKVKFIFFNKLIWNFNHIDVIIGNKNIFM